MTTSESDKHLCSKCGQLQPIDMFCKDRSRPDGLHPWCRDCRKKRSDLYYETEHEKIRARQEAYRNAHREIVRTNNLKSYYKHREHRLSRGRERYRENRDNRLQQIRLYRKSHPGYYKTWTRVKLCKELGLYTDHRRKLVKSLYDEQGGICFYCGQPVGNEYHVDHRIPVSRGGTNVKTNLVIACASCNWRKSDRLPEEFPGRVTPSQSTRNNAR